MAAEPDDGHRDDVHEHHQHGHHEGHRSIRKYISTGELAIGLVVTLALAIAASKSPDRHDTGDDFARDEVVAVHELLHPAKTRHGEAHENADDHHDDGKTD